MEQTDILIPGQHYHWATKMIEYVKQVFATDDKKLIGRIAKEIVKGKYWEAYDCKDTSRQEYWRVVLVCFDSL